MSLVSVSKLCTYCFREASYFWTFSHWTVLVTATQWSYQLICWRRRWNAIWNRQKSIFNNKGTPQQFYSPIRCQMIFAKSINRFVKNKQNFILVSLELLLGSFWINCIHQLIISSELNLKCNEISKEWKPHKQSQKKHYCHFNVIELLELSKHKQSNKNNMENYLYSKNVWIKYTRLYSWVFNEVFFFNFFWFARTRWDLCFLFFVVIQWCFLTYVTVFDICKLEEDFC